MKRKTRVLVWGLEDSFFQQVFVILKGKTVESVRRTVETCGLHVRLAIPVAEAKQYAELRDLDWGETINRATGNPLMVDLFESAKIPDKPLDYIWYKPDHGG
jgi:hypothetical protein